MPKIRYYVSGHGLGHASRSCQIVNTLRRRHPNIEVEVASNAHPWFFAGFLDPAVPVRRQSLDVGVVQRDSLMMDEEETLTACRALLARRGELVTREAASLCSGQVDLVAADIPALAFAAAREAGVPAVGICNFTWDWIYRGLGRRLPGWEEVIATLAADYAGMDRLLALPFHAGFPAVGRVEPIPLVARRAGQAREETRRQLGIPAGARLGLVSFGGFGLKEFDFRSLGDLRDWIFLTEAELAGAAANLRFVRPGTWHYPDLVRAADAVVTKPGYGIVSEAIANGTAVLYTHRGAFPEQPLLVEGLRRYTRSREIGNEKLRRGKWGEALAALMAQPLPAETLPADGDVVAADRLAEMIL